MKRTIHHKGQVLHPKSRLKFIRDTENRVQPSGQMKRMAEFLCECKNTEILLISNVRSGHTVSCQKCKGKRVSEGKTKHGDCRTRFYSVWNTMLDRCRLKTSASYTKYGRRGIYVCYDWVNSYPKFKEWAIKNGYKEGLQIDRIDNNGPYTPNNCRWVTADQNKRNTRQSVVWVVDGVEHESLSQAVKNTGLSTYAITRMCGRVKGVPPKPNCSSRKLYPES